MEDKTREQTAKFTGVNILTPSTKIATDGGHAQLVARLVRFSTIWPRLKSAEYAVIGQRISNCNSITTQNQIVYERYSSAEET